MHKEYKDIVFTDHALDRVDSRSISADKVHATIHYPDKKKSKTDAADSQKFIRTINGRTYHVVATYLKKEHKWLVISAWVRGEDDQLPLSIQLLLLPFRIIWWLLKLVGKLVSGDRTGKQK